MSMLRIIRRGQLDRNGYMPCGRYDRNIEKKYIVFISVHRPNRLEGTATSPFDIAWEKNCCRCRGSVYVASINHVDKVNLRLRTTHDTDENNVLLFNVP